MIASINRKRKISNGDAIILKDHNNKHILLIDDDKGKKGSLTSDGTYIHTYMCVYVCVCVCVTK